VNRPARPLSIPSSIPPGIPLSIPPGAVAAALRARGLTTRARRV